MQETAPEATAAGPAPSDVSIFKPAAPRAVTRKPPSLSSDPRRVSVDSSIRKSEAGLSEKRLRAG
jgi:hypothetical protein